jgi:hypothetical protein
MHARRRPDISARHVFHSICGCRDGEPVEKASKSLTPLKRVRRAKYFVTGASCDDTFSTAAVDAPCASLWTSLSAIFGDKHLACVGECFGSGAGGRIAHGFPQLLWMRAGQVCGQVARRPLATGTCYTMPMFCSASVAQAPVFHSVCGAAWEKPVDR